MPTKLPLRFKISRIGEPDFAEYGASKTPLDSPTAVWEFWKAVISTRQDYEPEKENLIVILLNTRLLPTGYNLVALGGLNECIAHPREIFRPAIVAAAHGFVISHNHPSGDPTPSEADRRLTRRLMEGAQLLEIRLYDHVVIGDPGPGRQPYYSFREAGLV